MFVKNLNFENALVGNQTPISGERCNSRTARPPCVGRNDIFGSGI